MVPSSGRAGLQGWTEFTESRSQQRPSQADAQIRLFLDPTMQAPSVGTQQGNAAEYPPYPP